MKKRVSIHLLAVAVGLTVLTGPVAPASADVADQGTATAAGGTAPATTPPVAVPPPTPAPATASSTPATTAADAGNQPINTVPPASAAPQEALPPPRDFPRIVPRPAANDNNRVVLEHADDLYLDENNVVTASGHVKLLYRSYIMTADKAMVDTAHSIATITGNVVVSSTTSSLVIRTTDPTTAVVIDLKHGTYHVHGGEKAVIPPEEITESGVLLPVFLNGGDINAQTDFIDARDAGVTTCDFINPHYELVSWKITVRPGKRLVARHVTIYRRGHRLFTLPLIVLPLDDRYQRQQYMPQLGVSPDEGYFAKFAVPYAATALALGLFRVDVMQKKGVGLGIDQGFTFGKSTPSGASQGGLFKIYSLKDRTLGLQTLTGSLQDYQRLPLKINMRFNAQFANNSYFFSNSRSKTMNSNLLMTRNVGNSATTLNTSLQQSNFGTSQTTNLNANLDQRLTFKHSASADLRIGYASNTTGPFASRGGSDQSSITTDFAFEGPTGRLVQFEFLTDTFTSLTNIVAGSSSTSTLGGIERYPELRLTASPIDGKKNPILRIFPLMNFLTVSLGDFHDPSANARTERLLLNINTGPQSHRKKRIVTSYLGQFEQDFYGNNTARYILNGTLGAVYAIGDRSNFTVNYGTLRPYGYTPFFFDRTGYYDNASANLTYEPTRKIQIVLASGYDFTQSHSTNGLPAAPWQNLSIQLIAKPNNVFINRIVTTYDPNHGRLFDVSDDFHAGMPRGFALQSGIRYSPSQHTFSTITANLTLPIITNKLQQAGYKLQALGGYNGYTKMWTYDGLELTRSWHDYALSAIVQNNLSGTPGTTFYLNFSLKAFPGYQPFGVGQFGQGLDTSIGNIL